MNQPYRRTRPVTAAGARGSYPTRTQLALLILATVLLVVLVGRLIGRPAAPAINVFLGADVSISDTSAQRKSDMGAVGLAVDTDLPVHSPMHAWVFDADAKKCYDGNPDRSRDLWPLEDFITSYVSRTAGTAPAKALEQMTPGLTQAEKAREQSVIILAWDGGCEIGRSDLQKVIAHLAKMHSIRAVWLVGVKTDEALRSDAERLFAPFGTRLIISGSFDMASGIETLRDRIQEAPEDKR